MPGIIYKLEPENEKQRKLQNVRKLWAAVIDTTGISDIYSGRLLEKRIMKLIILFRGLSLLMMRCGT